MPTLQGTTHASNGEPAIEVAAFVWRMSTWGVPYRAFPDPSGAWTLTVPQERYGVVFFFAHCPPEAQGPYEPEP
jgi:hypothetical protein